MIGTFVVRSGVLTSVHSFAVDPARGSVILAIAAVSIGAAFSFLQFERPNYLMAIAMDGSPAKTRLW